MINKMFIDKSEGFKTYRLAAIDIENCPETGKFICAGYCDAEGAIYYDNIEALEKKLLSSKGYKLLAFNWGYDHPFISNVLDDNSLFYSGSRFISCKMINGVKLIDLMNHVDGTLEDWMGYLNLGTKETLDDLKVRVLSDVKATYELGVYIQNFYNDLGISLKLTVSSASLALFRKKYLHINFMRDSDVYNDFERQAYYGGRVEVYRRGEQDVYSYDVNSMYLSIMKDELFPNPKSAHLRTKQWKKHFNDKLGIYHCKVYAPKKGIMVLPFKQGGKLIFPHGTFTGTWTNVELIRAMERGYKILEVYSYIVYNEAVELFKQFATDIWAKRKECDNKGMNKMIKKIGNSLYGKFAQRNEVGGYYGRLNQYTGDITGTAICKEVDGVEYISIPSTTKEEAFNSFPCVAVFIASYARLKLLDKMLEHEDSIVYCDTDSCKYLATDVKDDHSGELGDFGYEYHKIQIFYRPKFYADKIKGVPKRAVLYSDLETHNLLAEYEKPMRYKESLRRGLTVNKWSKIIKKINLKDNKRLWINDNLSEPLEVKQCRK